MTKEEVLALGVPEDKYREFQTLYNRDLNKLSKHYERAEADEGYQTRSAIHAMLKMIKKPKTLHDILKYINKAYYREV